MTTHIRSYPCVSGVEIAASPNLASISFFFKNLFEAAFPELHDKYREFEDLLLTELVDESLDFHIL